MLFRMCQLVVIEKEDEERVLCRCSSICSFLHQICIIILNFQTPENLTFAIDSGDLKGERNVAEGILPEEIG